MRIKRIRLKSLKNTRDLGGITTADGKRIRQCLLIRSGHLATASYEDIDILVNKYSLSHVIDLRTDAEIKEKPEILPDYIEKHFLPLLDNGFLGIARDEYSIRSWFNVFENTDRDPVEVFCDMYDMLVFSERSKVFVREFFDILLNSNGSVLWHCSAGKDRVGIMTMLLLLALGVDKETIIKDYMATRYFTAGSIIYTCFFGSFIYRTKRLRRCLAVLMDVREVYLERIFDKISSEYKSTEDFFYTQYGISESELNLLRKKYLL